MDFSRLPSLVNTRIPTTTTTGSGFYNDRETDFLATRMHSFWIKSVTGNRLNPETVGNTLLLPLA